MKVIGILLLVVAAVFGVLFLSEGSRYLDLQSDGNPFSSMVANSAMYCLGIACTAGLSGLGLVIAPSRHHAHQMAPSA
ncbi:MAG: hypothetical protein KGP12_05830 [Actinomycetales bacterium]|nr:hypothetical protein [Actinomycetales bacterium]